jgi:hypothetical protein
MTLKDKLEVEIMHLPLTDDVINAIGIELEQRAENFAIGFAEWVCDCEYNIQWFKDQNRTNELLEMYKKTL